MWTRLWNKLRFLTGREPLDETISEELAFHRAMLERDLAHDGIDRERATAAASRKLGNLTTAREDSRDAWIVRWVDVTFRDVRFAWRSYMRAPAFTLAAVATLSLGLGANMAIFRFVDAVMLETLPVPSPHELVLVTPGYWSYPTFRDLEAGTRDVLAAAAAISRGTVNFKIDGRSESLDVELVSGGYFDTLRVQPIVGRVLNRDDDGTEGAHAVCVITYGLWQRAFAGDPGVAGRVVHLNEQPFEIVGVTARGFEGSALHDRVDILLPTSATETITPGNRRDSTGYWWLRVIARLAPGMSREQAGTAVRARFEQPNLRRPLELAEAPQGFGILRFRLETPVLVAQALSACVFLIACANLAGLLLARASARRHELAVRRSLGASRRRVTAALVIEAAGLTILGGIVGLGLAIVLDRTLVAMLSGPDQPLFIASMPSVQGVTAAVGLFLVAVLAVGLLPALAATRERPLDGLRESSRIGGGAVRLRAGLVVVQVVVCLVLVFGAGLFARTLYGLRSIELGYDPTNVIVLSASPARSGYPDERAHEFFAEWLRGARRVPGVASASLASITVMSGGMSAANVKVPDAVARDTDPNNNFTNVSPDYFRTVGVPLVAGRAFTDADTAEAPAVAVVNEQFVEHYWPGQSPIGRQFWARGRDVTVVGLVRTAKYRGIRDEPEIMIYQPVAQRRSRELTLHARVAGGVPAASAAIAAVARDLDPGVPVYSAATIADYLDAQLGTERILSALGILFGSLALLVAAAGLYGLVAYAVTRRTREIGIRTAIGATRADIVALFMKQGLWLTGLGLVVGAPLALLTGRLFSNVLYGVDSASLPVLAGASSLLALVALAAVFLPALRAARLNPTVTLKEP